MFAKYFAIDRLFYIICISWRPVCNRESAAESEGERDRYRQTETGGDRQRQTETERETERNRE